jgi:hypothetical protein
MENTEENCEMIWKAWKKGKLKLEKIWKIWKKAKLNNEKPYFYYLFTIQLSFLPYCPYLISI